MGRCTHRWCPDENTKYPKRIHHLDHQVLDQYCVHGNMTTWPIIEHIKVYTNKKYSIVMLVDSNNVISILSPFLTELNTVYPEQLSIVYQLDSSKILLSLSSGIASPCGPTPFDGWCWSLFQIRNVFMFLILASLSSESAIYAQKPS